MKLDEYLSEKGITEEVFATMVGVGQSQVNRWRNGVSYPSLSRVEIIHRVTGGNVRPEDWYGREVAQ